MTFRVPADDARQIADLAMSLTDQGESMEERAATLLLHAAWMLFHADFREPDPKAERYCRNEGICPCKMVVDENATLPLYPGIGRLVELWSIKPAWLAAQALIEKVEAVSDGRS